MTHSELQTLVTQKDWDGASNLYSDAYKKLDDDPIEQFHLAKYAAILGVPDAIHHVVDSYQNGTGVEPNRAKAFEWIKRAATQGAKNFYFILALAYRDGEGTAIDVTKFWEWMIKAARNNEIEAMFQLAKAHLDPKFGPPSPAKAFEWTWEMANHNAPGAMIELARHFRDGARVKQDIEESLKWAEKSASVAGAAVRKARSNASNAGQDDWAYEDYPEALAMLADLYELRGKAADARKKNNEAAAAAEAAIEFGMQRGASLGLRLPEIMLRPLRQCRKLGGEPKARSKEKFFLILDSTVKAIDKIDVSSNTASVFPPDLSQAIFDLAIAHRDGTGTKASRKLFLNNLEHAAKKGHSEAAYLYAMHCRTQGNKADFSIFINKAADSGHNYAYIAKRLGECNLADTEFKNIQKLLQELWDTVDRVRTKKHSVTKRDASSGVAHYTNGDALNSMLNTEPGKALNVLRLSSIAYVNDPQEGKRLKMFGHPNPNPLAPFFREHEQESEPTSWKGQNFLVFLVSFSMIKDSLDLWRLYGNDGKGFCVVTPLSAFSDASARGPMRGAWAEQTDSSPQMALYKVLYKDKDAQYAIHELTAPLKKVNERIELLQNNAMAIEAIRSIVVTIISELMYLYKIEDYENEKEVRAVSARSLTASDLKRNTVGQSPFAKLYIESQKLLFKSEGSEIVIGPKVEKVPSVLIDIRHRLACLEWTHCKVWQSTKPYQ